jgi:arylsulfatase A-like enzyme
MDDSIGQIMAAIRQRGMDEDTILFFCSDNGGAPDLGALNDPLRGSKTSLYEGGIRVPAFIRCPGRIEPRTVIDHPLHMVDLYPTLLGQAGVSTEQEKPVDGIDFWPVVAEGATPPREEILLNAAPYLGSIRVGDWKLVRNGHLFSIVSNEGKPDKFELFNLADDPSEEHDLSDAHPEKLEELKSRLEKYTDEAVTPFKATIEWPPKKEPGQWQWSDTPKCWGQASSES